MSSSASATVGVATRRRLRRRVGRWAQSGLTHVALIGLTIFSVFPLYYMITSSLKSATEIDAIPPTYLPVHVTLQNYQQAMGGLFPVFFANSVKIAVISMILALLISSLSAFCLTRFTTRGRDLFARAILVSWLFPGLLFAVPLFVVYSKLGLVNTHLGVIIAYTTFSLPLSMWMMMAYLDTIPKQLDEAARVDGAGNFVIFFRIVLPLARPGLALVAILTFLAAWNEFLLGFLLLRDNELRTLTVGLFYLLGQGSATDNYLATWGARTAAGVLMSIPPLILFVLISDQLVKGISGAAGGGLKM